MDKNDRLGKAMEVAKATKYAKDRKSRVYTFERPEIQRKVQAMRLLKPKKPECTYMRIHLDAKKLAEQAWPTSDERVVESSSAIREAAKNRLGL